MKKQLLLVDGGSQSHPC